MKDKRLFTYVSVFASILSIVLLSYYINTDVSLLLLYLILILIITINSWLNGFKFTLIIIALAMLSVTYTVVSNINKFDPLVKTFEIILFLISASFISLIIEKYKKTDTVREYVNREKKLKEKIAQQNDQIEKMRQEIKMRDEFLSIASHELKTPLTSMLLRIQRILHNIKNVSLANFSIRSLLEMLETAESQTQKLSRMISDLLNVSLVTTGKFSMEPKKEDLIEIVKQVNHEQLDTKEKVYRLNIKTKKPVWVMVDKLRISQVYINLLTNAVRYGNGKPIDIQLKNRRNVAQLSVKDRGKGIKKEDAKKIFSLFERGSANNNSQGLGVGLYIANQLVKAQNGKIKLKSRPGRGSTFTIELPRMKG